MPEEKPCAKVFVPSARITWVWGLWLAPLTVPLFVGLVAYGAWTGRLGSAVFAAVIGVFLHAGWYLRYLMFGSARIEVAPEGITNVMRSGKAYSILWCELSDARHSVWPGGGHWGAWVLKSRTGHRLHIAADGLTDEQWEELTGLIRGYASHQLGRKVW